MQRLVCSVCCVAVSVEVQRLGQCCWRTHRSRHSPFPTAFHLPVTFLMGLKKSFQRAIHVWWLYWFFFHLSSLPLFPSLSFHLPLHLAGLPFPIDSSAPTVAYSLLPSAISPTLLVATGHHFPTLQIKASRIGLDWIFFSLLFITMYCSVWNMLLLFDRLKMCLHNVKRQVHRVLLYLNRLKSLDQFICSLPAAETDVLNPERFMVYNIIWVKISSVQKLSLFKRLQPENGVLACEMTTN